MSTTRRALYLDSVVESSLLVVGALAWLALNTMLVWDIGRMRGWWP